jgi:hypothetical protein
MDGRTGIPLVLLAGAMVVLGLAWGSASQKETFIGNAETEDPAVAGDITIITGFLVGLGVAIGCMAIGPATVSRRASGAIIAGLCSWGMVFLLQSAWPNYVVLPELGQASISQNNLLLESAGAATVMLPVLCLGGLLLIGIGWGLQMAGLVGAQRKSMSGSRRGQLVLAAMGVPLLVVAASGYLRTMLEIPPGDPGQGLMAFIHPIAAAACLAIATTLVVRSIQLARSRVDPDATWPVMESWRAMDRVDLAGMSTLLLVAAMSSFLPSDDPTNVTRAGLTLLFTLRTHGQMILLLGVFFVPMWIVHQRIGANLALARGAVEPDDTGAMTLAWVTMGVSIAGAILGAVVSLVTDRSLLPWVLAFLPASIIIGLIGSPIPSVIGRIFTAWTLWGMGNSIRAVYQANTFPDLDYAVHPGMLALWRFGAVSLGVWAGYDLFAHIGRSEKSWVRVSMALLASIGPGFVVLMLFPLSVWAESALPVNRVALGSLLRNQLGDVQVMMHVLSVAFILAASMAGARLCRPDWFSKDGMPTPILEKSSTPG